MNKVNVFQPLDEVKKDLQSVVVEAGEILKKHFHSTKLTSRQKKGVDFTTQADEEVDKFLRDALKAKYPSSNFLTEETAPDDYSSLTNTENLWIIDPLDGTINFSRKHPNFAISIALVHKNEIKLGIVYLPLLDKLYCAQSDKEGAYENGKQIYVSQTSALRETVVACDWAWDLQKRKNVIHWISQLAGHIRQIKSMGSAAADLCSLAEGRIDAYIHSGLKPWDVPAAALIIQKAGGVITLPTGQPWSPFHPDIFACNKNMHEQILELLTSKVL